MQFSKWPESGKVKTRLEPALGKGGALKAHIALSMKVLENLVDSGFDISFMWDRPLSQPPEEAASILQRLDELEVPQASQSEGVLGSRMATALTEALTCYENAIIVGSDCPSVDSAYVAQAAEALKNVDVVLGPSDDGGYVLIGARRVVPGMLDGVAWGTEQALEQTVQRLTSAGLSHRLLEPRWDVDEPEDWRRFLREFPNES